LIDLELAGQRDVQWNKYSAILNDIGYRLRLDCCPVHLERETAPEWVAREPELNFLRGRARLAFLRERSIKKAS
jgi:hypothetical protein